jgi:RAB6A-GEF complex partner protein 2
MPPDGPSPIRVFIRWQDQTIFAGEEIKCTITFKNVAPGPNQQRQSRRQQPNLDSRQRHATPLQARAKGAAGAGAGLTPPTSASSARGHRSALSLSVPPAGGRSRAGSTAAWPPSGSLEGRQGQGQGHAHKKSISIVSIGSVSTADGQSQSNASSVKSHRSNRGHARASSLQIVARGAAIHPGPNSGT